MNELSPHFRWEIEFLKNISSLNILFYSTEISNVELQVRPGSLIFEIAGKEINKIKVDQFKVKQMEKKQWTDHLQIKIQILPHEDKEYSFIQSRWQETLPEVPQLQQMFCKFCHQSLLSQKEENFEKLQRLPGIHWEEIKDAWWVCACNATALEQSPSIPKGFIRARIGRLLLSESYVLIHNDNISPLSFRYHEKDKAKLDKLEKENGDASHYIKSNVHELQVQQWIELFCSQCNINIGLKEIPNQVNESQYNFKFWKHKVLTNLSTENCFWRNRSVCSMLSSDMFASMTDHGSYRFHIMHLNQLIAQIVVTNWSSFLMAGQDFVSDTINLTSLRPIIKISFRDCYSDPENAKKFENQWRSKYQIEHISYSLLDCFELLTTFHQNNRNMPSMCQEFSGMLNSWIYYLPST